MEQAQTDNAAVAEHREPLQRDGPRIYVASLSDYTAGRLHGAWLDADQDVADLQAAVDEILAASSEPGAEEFAVHDFDGFGHYQPGEYESLASIASVAAGITEHGLAYAALAADIGAEELAANPEQFYEHFHGTWPSLTAFAENLAEELGWAETLYQLPASWSSYVTIDYAMLARDLAVDLHIVEHAAGVWVFDTRF